MSHYIPEELPKGYTHSAPYDSGFLPVGDIHKLHYEQYGNQNGLPALYLHGGPGGSCSITDTVYFDPAIYRVVMFDQRGAGKSLPVAELRENTSYHLVADIEALREHLGLEKWPMVFGGSWGSTLSLLYAQTHPNRVGSLVVQGVFTSRKSEIEFCSGSTGAAHLFPEGYDEMVNFLPEEERNDVFGSYYRRITSGDYQTRLKAAQAYSKWELLIGQLIPDQSELDMVNDEKWCLQHASMELHYDINGAWLEEGQLLKPKNVEKIQHIPCSLIP